MAINEFPIPTVDLGAVPAAEFPALAFSPLRSLANLVSKSTAANAAPDTPIYAELLSNITVTSAAIVPKNLFIFPRNGAKIVKGTGGSVEFQGVGIAEDTTTQIFSGFAAGEVKWTGQLPDVIRPEWWGGKLASTDLNQAGDLYPHFMAAQKAIETESWGYGGTTIQLSDGWYKSSQTLHIIRPVSVLGREKESAASGDVRIQFPPDTVGMRVLPGTAIPNNKNNWETALGCRIRGFALHGAVGGNNTVVSGSGLTLSLVGGDITKIAGNAAWDDPQVKGVPDGSTIKLNNFYYIIEGLAERAANDYSTVHIRRPRVYLQLMPDRRRVRRLELRQPLPTGNAWVGQTTVFWHQFEGRFERVIESMDAEEIVFTEPLFSAETYAKYDSVGHRGTVTVQGINPVVNAPARLNIFNGLEVGTQCKAENVAVRGFGGNGMVYWTSRSPANSWNTNTSNAERLFSFYNEGSGFVQRGIDSNAMDITMIETSYNAGAGFYENGSFGTNYDTLHSAYNLGGAVICAGQLSQSVFKGCYTEGGQLPIILARYTLWLGGINGAGIDDEDGYGGWASAADGKLSNNGGFMMQRKPDRKFGRTNEHGYMVQMGGQQMPALFGAFGAAEDAGNMANTSPTINPLIFPVYPSYVWTYDKIKRGWYSMHFTHDTDLATEDNAVFAVSGAVAAEGAGQVWLPNGFYIGRGTTRQKWGIVEGMPISGEVARGDKFWNSGAGAGDTEPVLWTVSEAGTLGDDAVLSETTGEVIVIPPYVPTNGYNFNGAQMGIYSAGTGLNITGDFPASHLGQSITFDTSGIVAPPPSDALKTAVFANPGESLTAHLPGFTPNAKYRMRLITVWDEAAYSFSVAANGSSKGVLSVPADSELIPRAMEFYATADGSGNISITCATIVAQALICTVDWMAAE